MAQDVIFSAAGLEPAAELTTVTGQKYNLYEIPDEQLAAARFQAVQLALEGVRIGYSFETMQREISEIKGNLETLAGYVKAPVGAKMSLQETAEKSISEALQKTYEIKQRMELRLVMGDPFLEFIATLHATEGENISKIDAFTIARRCEDIARNYEIYDILKKKAEQSLPKNKILSKEYFPYVLSEALATAGSRK
jgi:hypothetical protein